MDSRLSAFSSIALLVMLITVVFSISCMLTANNAVMRIHEREESSFAEIIMDAGRIAVSSYLFEQADLYFHMGKARETDLAFAGGFFQRLHGRLSPSAHEHRHGEDTKEMLPWLWLALKTDPHNMLNYAVSSFWLASELHRPDLARKLWKEARWQNPFNYFVEMQDAILALHAGNTREAASLLDVGLALWPGKTNPQDYDTMNDKAKMLLYRALLYEAEGKPEDAIEKLKSIITLFPDRTEIGLRISELKEGKEPSLLASGPWTAILKQEIEKSRKEINCEQCDQHRH